MCFLSKCDPDVPLPWHAGPGCVLQSCVIQRGARIGAGAVVMEGALIEEFAEVAPGSVVHPGRRVPKGQEWGGNPIAFVRDLSKEELGHREAEAEELSDAAAEHSSQFLPVGTVYRDVSWGAVPLLPHQTSVCLWLCIRRRRQALLARNPTETLNKADRFCPVFPVCGCETTEQC
jgi:hypothetical protein